MSLPLIIPKAPNFKPLNLKTLKPNSTASPDWIIIWVSHACRIGALAGLRRHQVFSAPLLQPHLALCGFGGALAHDISFFFFCFFFSLFSLYFMCFVIFYFILGGQTEFLLTHLVDHKLSSFYFVNSKWHYNIRARQWDVSWNGST